MTSQGCYLILLLLLLLLVLELLVNVIDIQGFWWVCCARGSLYGGVLATSDADSPPKMVCPLSKLRHVSAAD